MGADIERCGGEGRRCSMEMDVNVGLSSSGESCPIHQSMEAIRKVRCEQGGCGERETFIFRIRLGNRNREIQGYWSSQAPLPGFDKLVQ